MIKRTALIVILNLGIFAAQTMPQGGWNPVRLPSGKVLVDPPAGRFISDLNAFPINSAVSPDGRYVAFLNNGYGYATSGFRKSVAILDRINGQVSDNSEPGTGLKFDGPAKISTLFYGIAFSSNGKQLYVSVASTKRDKKMGDRTQNGIRIYDVGEEGLSPSGSIQILPSEIPFPAGVKLNNPSPTPSGLSVCPDLENPGSDLIYAALTLSDAAVELSTKTGKVRRVFDLHVDASHPAIPAEYPYATALSPDGKTLFVSLYNGSAVAAVDLASQKVTRLPIGTQQAGPSSPSSHPSHMAVHPSGKAVYVAVENCDQVGVIDNDPASPRYRTVIDTFDVRTEEMKSLKIYGAGPNHLTFTPDGKLLFVSMGLLNAIAVVDVDISVPDVPKHRVRGYLPALWFPHTTEVSPDGRTLYITSGKGRGTGPNVPNRPFPPAMRPGPYIPTLLKGSLHEIRVDDALANLGTLTASVRRNNQLDPDSLRAAQNSLAFNPIKHVIYVIRENRTYDQVFGDLEKTRADGTCLYFGEKFTPNAHRIAREFGIYDNFFDSAEVSFNGHTWSTAGINSGWNEQQWQINYSTGNFTYDSEGRNNDVLPIQYNQSDVDTPLGGYLWDSVVAAGKKVSIYGEFCENPAKPLRVLRKGDPMPAFLINPRIGDKSPYPWQVPLFGFLDENGQVIGGTVATKSAFKESFQPLFPDFDQLFPDVLRFSVWKRDFDRIASLQKETGKDTLADFMIVRLGNDHTRGVAPRGPTPDASVADNDVALGMLVEAISSNEYYWGNTAIIVLEDDAQAGCDHVDAHRSVLLFISKYSVGSTREPNVDSRFLTTASAVRTIEALLGLPANNLMTATSPLLFRRLEQSSSRWHGPYKTDYANLDNGLIYQEGTGKLREQPALKKLARLTATLNLEDADQADANTLNYILQEWVRSQGRLACCGK